MANNARQRNDQFATDSGIGHVKMPPFAQFIDLCSDSDSDGWPPSPSSGWKKGSATTPKTTAATVTTTRILPPAVLGRDAAPQKTAAPTPRKTETKRRPKPRPAPSAPAMTEQPSAPTPDISSLVNQLNSAQRRAVTSNTDTVAILAGPGSGKTHTLTSRVAWLIDVVGYAPHNVIVATFTVKAAREMKERIGKVLGNGREKKIVLGTFHSVSLRYLSAYGTRIGLERGFSIVDDGDSRSIIKRIVKRLNFDLEPAMVRGWISKKKAKGCLGEQQEQQQKQGRQRAGQGGQTGKPDNKDYIKRLEAVYDAYQAHLGSLNLFDYDDLLVRCTELLRAHPECVSNVQAVLIDEYQDTNGIQFELMKLFAQAHNRITVVGDPDQSIYGWRSAEITNLSRFLSDFPHTAEISLEENYRSSQCILGTSLQVIQQDQERYDKSLLPVHKKGTLPVLRRLKDSGKEADWIVQEIRRAAWLSGGMLEHSDIAILVRSAFLSRPIEQALARAAIPYRMIGGRKFFERAEIKILVDYLRVIHQPNNNEVLSRIINVPKRGVGAVTLKGCLEEAECAKMSMWMLLTKHCKGDITAQTDLKKSQPKINKFIGLIQNMQKRLEGGGEGDDDKEDEKDDKKNDKKNDKKGGIFSVTATKPHNLVELIEALIEHLKYRDYIGETYGGDEEARWGNVEEFITLAREFMNNATQLMMEDELPVVDGVEQMKETDVLAKFLANISLSADADKKDEEKEKPMVTISTIHAAKGLEWPVVFIPAAYDGSLPHSRSEDFSEERRLLYVAMTRAKCLLNVSYALYGSQENGKSEQPLSPFLEPVVGVWFAEHGPSYNRTLLDEIGDILRRKAPTDQEIYKNMPVGVPLEDDKFPIDPMAETRYQNEDEDNGYEYSSRWRGGGQQNAKRRKTLETPNYTPASGGVIGGGGPWQRGYSTTMESAASNFTMGSFPGFTTATAHQTALLAVEATSAAQEAAEAKRILTATDKRKRGGAAPLASGQQTIMQSFVRSNSNSIATKDAAPELPQLPAHPPQPIPAGSGARAYQQSTGMFSMQQQRPAAPPGIPPELKSRSLGGVRGNMMMAGRQSGTKSEFPSNAGGREQTARYAHFSSSPPPTEVPAEPTVLLQYHSHRLPPMPPPQQQQQQQRTLQPRPQPYQFNRPRPIHAPHQQRQVSGKENQRGTGMAGGIDSKIGAPAANAAPRPAATFHNTTYAQTLASGHASANANANANNGYKRPAASMTGGCGVAPMDKLRMPFKPPSVRRP